MTEKLCPKCEKTLPVDQFHVRPTGKPAAYCKECFSIYSYCIKEAKKRGTTYEEEVEQLMASRAYRAKTAVLAEQGLRQCWECAEVKSFSEFRPSATTSSGMRRCRDCNRYYIQEKKYGISTRDRSCEICGATEKDKELHVDHCHATDVTRGVLCENCNLGIGHFGDRLDLLLRAAEYLIESRSVVEV